MSDSFATCPPLLITFKNLSQNFTAVNWDFGDGTSTQNDNPSHLYTVPGIYFAKLIITSPGGCMDTMQKQVSLKGPYGTFTYAPLSGCKPLTVNFTGSAINKLTFIWDYSDGNINITPDSIITHTYTIPGSYVPKMILKDPNGCTVTIPGIDTVLVVGLNTNFNFNSQAKCDSASIAFFNTSTSNANIASYLWNFGDGTTSTLQNPIHFYSTTGLYYPTLIITSAIGCSDTLKDSIPVRIVATPKAIITSSPNGCTPLSVNFNGSLLIADTSIISWNWKFANGTTSNLQAPPTQIYNIAGTYITQLIAINSSGCKDSVTKSIEAYAVPIVNAGVDTFVCLGKSTILNATGYSSYTWSPATGLSCTNCANPIATPVSKTLYVVNVITPNGCTNSDSVLVNVKLPFTMYTNDDTLCVGNAVRIFATGAYSYSWSPSTGLNSTIIQTPLAMPSTTTTYQVIGKDDKGCFSDTGFVTVNVFQTPTVNAGANQTIKMGNCKFKSNNFCRCYKRLLVAITKYYTK